MQQSTPRRRLPSLLTLLISTGCNEFTTPLAKQLGTATADYVVGEYAWTPDSRRIVYVSNGRDSRAYEVEATGHTSRASTMGVTGSNGTNRTAQIGTQAGAYYFGVVQDRWCSPATIYQSLAMTAVDTVATDVSNAWFVTSPSGNRVAFTAVAYPPDSTLCPDFRDSLVVLDVLGPTRGQRRAIERHIGWSDGLPLSLGDDGSLVYLGTDRTDPRSGRSVVRYAPSLGSARDVWRPASDSIVSEAVGLDVASIGGAPHLTIARSRSRERTATIEDLDVITGQMTLLATLQDVGSVMAFTRSTDGRAWAAWVLVEDRGPCVMERHCLVTRLLVNPPGASTPIDMASFDGDSYPGRMKFSPDVSWLAFMYGSSLYVRGMP
jgi:hypothetical protein